MNRAEIRLTEKAAALRQAFDRSFAEAVQVEAIPVEDLLAIHIASDPYAIRLTEIAGLFADKRVTPFASPVAEFLGLAGMRGTMVPIYDLRLLFGCPANTTPRWFVLAAHPTVGLAFDRFDAHIRISRDALLAEDNRGAFVRGVARTSSGMLPVIHLPSVLGVIEKKEN